MRKPIRDKARAIWKEIARRGGIEAYGKDAISFYLNLPWALEYRDLKLSNLTYDLVKDKELVYSYRPTKQFSEKDACREILLINSKLALAVYKVTHFSFEEEFSRMTITLSRKAAVGCKSQFTFKIIVS